VTVGAIASRDRWIAAAIVAGLLVVYNANGREIGSYDSQPTKFAARELLLRGTLTLNHVVGANVRYQLLLHGAPTEQVAATRTVDHLGDDALVSFVATADGVVACFHEDGALERIAHHATGDRTGRELLSMRILDAAIHAWDLARAIGANETLDDDVVAFLLAYTADLDLGAQQPAFAPADADVPRNGPPQAQLLHRLGRHPNITRELR